jgi:phosphatidylserine/phosphatidylglycerophosphate/cardiolipin synthase-like enzyme
VRLFNPLPSRGGGVGPRIVASLHEFSRINLRMHNKLFIADNRFSISGGRNMAEEYFMRSSEANFIDMDVIAAGTGRPRAVASVRSLLEQQRRPTRCRRSSRRWRRRSPTPPA